MPLPRRCKHCKCFAAPWLKRCPRCNKVVPAPTVVVKLTKEEKKLEKKLERAKQDIGVPVIHQKNMQWVPSAFSIASHKSLLEEVQRKIARAETAHERNVLRSEIRAIKQVLNKSASPSHRWTTELFHVKQASISVFISPKGKRYVTAHPDAKADLIIKNRKSASTPLSRLQLFDKSPYFKMKKAEQKQKAVHKKRSKIKKVHRAHKRKIKKSPTLS